MLYLRLCFDRPSAAWLRKSLREKHRAYLRAHVGKLQPVELEMAGPLCVSDADDTNLASMMILEAGTLDEVLSFHQRDPFTEGGLYERVDIHRWDKHLG